ncbi:MAG: hypothetical protein AAFQ47_13790 [Pseudomonadota bacterium]
MSGSNREDALPSHREELGDEVAVRRAEYLLDKKRFELEKRSSASEWRNVIFVPVLLAVLAAFANAGTTFYSAKTAREISEQEIANESDKELLHSELNALRRLLNQGQRAENVAALCDLWRSNFLEHEITIQKLNQLLEDGSKCLNDPSTDPNPEPLPTGEALTVESCISLASRVQSSARAYDKSGFHSRPSDSTTISLVAPEDSFLLGSSLEIVSESYRSRPRGDRASDQLLARAAASAIATDYTAQLSCTNSSGTGRTCEARIVVAALAFPDSCTELSDEISATLSSD